MKTMLQQARLYEALKKKQIPAGTNFNTLNSTLTHIAKSSKGGFPENLWEHIEGDLNHIEPNC